MQKSHPSNKHFSLFDFDYIFFSYNRYLKLLVNLLCLNKNYLWNTSASRFNFKNNYAIKCFCMIQFGFITFFMQTFRRIMIWVIYKYNKIVNEDYAGGGTLIVMFFFVVTNVRHWPAFPQPPPLNTQYPTCNTHPHNKPTFPFQIIIIQIKVHKYILS